MTTPTLSEKDFILRAIENLRTPPYKGIHTVYSGFNSAFREYFGKESDPVEATRRLAKEGAIRIYLAKGGAVIAKASEPKCSTALAKILSS